MTSSTGAIADASCTEIESSLWIKIPGWQTQDDVGMGTVQSGWYNKNPGAKNKIPNTAILCARGSYCIAGV